VATRKPDVPDLEGLYFIDFPQVSEAGLVGVYNRCHSPISVLRSAGNHLRLVYGQLFRCLT